VDLALSSRPFVPNRLTSIFIKMTPLPIQAEKGPEIPALHSAQGLIFMPNPWDAGRANAPAVVLAS